MAARKRRFECPIVNEVVHIHLRRRRGRGFSSEDYHFVQCDQTDCQYADRNEPPCPLNVDMFEDELLERQKRRDRSRRSDYD